MKKVYALMTAVGLIFTSGSFAQQRIAKKQPVNIPSSVQPPSHSQQPVVQPMNVQDTLTIHLNLNSGHTLTLYSSQNGGYVSGHNGYGDTDKAQKFDANYGVTAGGTIKAILFAFGGKKQQAGTASFTPKIWSDISGAPGTVIGTGAPFTVAQIDTSAAAYNTIGASAAPEAFYNISATFSNPVNIPTNKTFWAGFTMTYAAGDSAGLMTSIDPTKDAPGATGDFPDATTNTFEKYNGNWQSFNDGTNNTWQLDVAQAIFPVVDLLIGVNENNRNVLSLSNTPNPARNNTLINYELKESAHVSISVFDVTGREIFSQSEGTKTQGKHQVKLDVSAISTGMYFYTLTAGNAKMTNKMTVVK